jgi:DNA-binding response OmpR family regulator
MRILIVEDEKALSDNIKTGLAESNFAVDQVFDGEEGLYLAQNETYDVIILDGMLPKLDGTLVAKELRKKGCDVPILMLTARSQLDDKISGLNAGADDYLTKPFEFEELKARIQALIRRSYKNTDSKIMLADLVIDPIKHEVCRNNKSLDLTPKEFAILELLARNKDNVVTRTQIIEHTWDYNFDRMSNVVDAFIKTLRKKVDSGNIQKLIHTVHGVGYKLSENP